MKRFVIPVLTILVLTVYACGGGGQKTSKPEVAAPAPKPATEETTASEETTSAAPSAAAATGTATISGKISFEGDAPKAKPINMAADKVCKQQHSAEIFQEDVVVSAEGAMKWIFVYVKSGISGNYPVPAEAAVIDQVGCQYVPHVFGVMVGQKLQIKNSDPLLHNVHATPANNAEFNKGQPKQGAVDEVTFDKEEIMMPFKCDVHPWMSAKANVMSHPFYAVSGPDGSFTIKDLPAGTYTIAAVSEKYGEKEAEVTVADGAAASQDFSFSRD